NGETATLSSPGTYYISAQLTDSLGYKVSSNVITITVNPDPTISISVPHDVYDVGQTLVVSTSTSQGTPPYTINYYLNGTLMNGETATLSSPGTYYISAQLTDSLGYKVSSNVITITVNPDPTMKSTYTLASSNFFYSNNVVNLNALMSGGTSPFTYTWYLNGQEVASTTSATYTYHLANMGQNILNVTATDATGYSVQAYTTVDYTYNYTNIAIIVIAIVAAVAISTAVIIKRKGHKTNPVSQQPENRPAPPPTGVAALGSELNILSIE
ncbi:MAG: hypothetical protein QXU98_13745, partial [Candidatus Parvarchaeota archaeon]